MPDSNHSCRSHNFKHPPRVPPRSTESEQIASPDRLSDLKPHAVMFSLQSLKPPAVNVNREKETLESVFAPAGAVDSCGLLSMELVETLEEMFRWRTPFCSTQVPNEVMGTEGTFPYLDAMLVNIEFPGTNLGPEQAVPASHLNPSSISLWPPSPVQIPFSPSLSTRTIPVVTPAIQAPASIRNPFVVNTRNCSVQTGIRGFETPAPAPTTGICSAPNSPAEGKPKRSRGSGSAKPKCPRPPKKKKSLQESGLDAAGSKSKGYRVPTTAEHIVRERQRREDMSAKYSTLESLLPPAKSKRERTVVVQDAISLVGALQQKKALLLGRRADLKLIASYNQYPWSKKMRSLAPLRGPLGAAVNHSQRISTKQRSSPENWNLFDSPLSTSSDAVVVRADPEIVTSAGTFSAIHVHMGEQEVVMEMVRIKPRPNFQSALLVAVESLGFDVTQCSFLRMGKGCIQCVVICSKSQVLPQRIAEIQSSSTLIIKALRNMLTRN